MFIQGWHSAPASHILHSPLMRTIRLLPLLMLALAAFGSPAMAQSSSPPVTISGSGAVLTLANGILSVDFNKNSGNLLAIRYSGMDLLDHSGYWNVYGEIPGGIKSEVKGTPSIVTVTQDPATTGGNIGEVELLFPYKARHCRRAPRHRHPLHPPPRRFRPLLLDQRSSQAGLSRLQYRNLHLHPQAQGRHLQPSRPSIPAATGR